MANNVTNIIEIEYDKDDDHITEVLDKLVSLMDEDEPLTEMYEESENTRAWWENNIGAKWAYIEDYEGPMDGYCRINIVSAWTQVTEFVEHLNELMEFSGKVTHQYMDEMPNFGGYAIYENGTIVKEMDIPDLFERIEEEANIRKAAENILFESVHEENDWMWDWMWDYAYSMIEPEED